jgi:hypothetical protein
MIQFAELKKYPARVQRAPRFISIEWITAIIFYNPISADHQE